MNIVFENSDSKSEQFFYKEKYFKLLEEKSILEDEIVSIAHLARSYQTQAKLYQEELESLKSSFQLICSQNSELESEIILITSNNSDLQCEVGDIKKNNAELMSEIGKLKEKVDRDSQNFAIKELSNIILSGTRDSPEKPISIDKYSEVIKEILEEKLKVMEKEREDYHQKCREYLSAYIVILKESLSLDRFSLQAIISNQPEKVESFIRKRVQENEFHLIQAETALENLEGEEVSFCTSMTGSPKVSEDVGIKSSKNLVPISLLALQASAIEELLKH